MGKEMEIKILIVDDSDLTKLGLNTTLKQCKDFKIVGSAENGKKAISMVQDLKPDIVLMDIGMPIMDGIQATKEIKKLNLDTKVIMLTSHDNERDVFDALSVGAYSYCMKDIEPEMLITVIKSTFNGASWLDSTIARIVLDRFNRLSKAKAENSILTDREIDILNLIAKGYSNSGISETLYISLNTVKTHIKNIFQKLEVGDRAQAVMTALKKDIIHMEQ